jgi:F0F1-type ATP synthase epsilon subunit
MRSSKGSFTVQKNHYGCSQRIILIGQEVLGLESEEKFKVTTGFAYVAKRVIKLFLEEEK